MKKKSEEVTLKGIPEAVEDPVDDEIDLKLQAVKVHSHIKEITADLTLANLRDDVLKSKILKFVKGQYQIAVEMKDFLVSPKEGAIAVKKILAELTVLLVGSRAENGKVLDSILDGGKWIQEATGPDPNEPKETMMEKGRRMISKQRG